MASIAAPIVTNGGTGASMWANQPGPTRSGWSGKTSESSPTVHGAGKGPSRGRGGRGGGRGGRSTNGKGSSHSKPESTSNKPAASVDQPQEKPPSDPQKPSPHSIPPTTASQPPASMPPKQSNRTKPGRRGSERKGSRKGPSLSVDPSAMSTSNTSSSPSVSPHTPHRKRGSSQASAPPPPPVTSTLPRKQSVTQENNVRQEKLPPTKDLPPHLAPPPPSQPTVPFDIKHDIDALVERVRAVAMDRPHTPGSHIDWAGEEDDSLPDLDDWGVPSTITAAPKTPAEPQVAPADVISPILEDTLKPLPMIDIDIPTPSIRLHEVSDAPSPTDGGDETPRETAPPRSTGPHTPTTILRPRSASKPSSPTMVSPVPSANTASGSPEASESFKDVIAGQFTNSDVSSSVHAHLDVRSEDVSSKDSSPSPDRSLFTSIHAMSSSGSAPNHLPSRPPRESFNPSHGRSHTVGRFKPEHHSDNDRPRRGPAFSHGRNHSTPPTGPGTSRAQARAPHATRPVISVDAISKLARTLGGTTAPRKPKEAASTASQAA